VRLSWAKLLKRVFEIDIEHCPSCGGEIKIIAAILAASAIKKILVHLVHLVHLGQQARAPTRRPAAPTIISRLRCTNLAASGRC
jgi:hypothetical protein